MKTYFVYILASNSRRLYIGFTNHLKARIAEHKSGKRRGFTSRYQISQLVHYETYADSQVAIDREKQIKNQPRHRKVALIERKNPDWVELVLE